MIANKMRSIGTFWLEDHEYGFCNSSLFLGHPKLNPDVAYRNGSALGIAYVLPGVQRKIKWAENTARTKYTISANLGWHLDNATSLDRVGNRPSFVHPGLSPRPSTRFVCLRP